MRFSLIHLLRLNKSILFNLGGRVNHFYTHSDFNTTFYPFPFESLNLNETGFSGSAGILYHPFDLTSISANISSGYRAPNIDDIGKFFDSVPGNVVVPNSNLSSEKAINYELSLSQIIGKNIRLDMTIYHINLRDGLVRRDFLFNGMDSIIYDGELSKVQATVNASQINIFGLQGGLEWRLPYRFNLYARVNIQKGEEDLDNGEKNPARHAPPTYGMIKLSKRIKGLTLAIENQFSGGFNFNEMPVTEIEKPNHICKG